MRLTGEICLTVKKNWLLILKYNTWFRGRLLSVNYFSYLDH